MGTISKENDLERPLLSEDGGNTLENFVELPEKVSVPASQKLIRSSIQEAKEDSLRRITKQRRGIEENGAVGADDFQCELSGSRQEGTAGYIGQRMKRAASVVSLDFLVSGTNYIWASEKKVSKRQKSSIGLLGFHILATMCWACSASLYYVWRLKWTFMRALYFTVQAGFGVGFGGTLLTEKDEHVDLDVLYFTSFAVCILGSLSVFSLFAFFLHEFRLHAFRSEVKNESKRLGLAPSKERVKCGKMVSNIVHWVLGGWLNSVCGSTLSALVFGSVMMSFVVIFGIVLGMESEKLNFHEALYFTISSIQSSGMIIPQLTTNSEIGCTLLVLIGVPTHAAFMSLLLESFIRPYAKSLEKKILKHRTTKEEQKLLEKIRKSDLNINNDDHNDVVSTVRTMALNRPSLSTANLDLKSLEEKQKVKTYKDSIDIKANATTPSGLKWTEFLEVELMRLEILEMDTLQSVWESFCIQSCSGSGKTKSFRKSNVHNIL